MNNFIRILILAALALITGFAIYGLIYAPRFFKAGAILMLGITVYLVVALVKQWFGSQTVMKEFTEAELVDENKND